MEQSYLLRAKHWIESTDDVDIDTIESTLVRFTMEYKKSSSSNISKSKIKDLEDTIEYLKIELGDLAGAQNMELEPIESPKQTNKNAYSFDPSPLIDLSELAINTLSSDQKHSSLSMIKKMPGIVTAGDLINTNRSDYK